MFADGSRVRLTLRRAEILALLDSRSQGWSAEELAYELHGDAGTPRAIRTEMFRIRSLLGDAVESNPYRFVAGLAGRSDSGRVLRLLREGRVAGAVDAYGAPLLSRSGTMAVQLLPDHLDLALGSAVRSSGDAGLLIRWLSTDMGSGDSKAVEALGRLVGRGTRGTCHSWRRPLSVVDSASPRNPLMNPQRPRDIIRAVEFNRGPQTESPSGRQAGRPGGPNSSAEHFGQHTVRSVPNAPRVPSA